jgi:hypothetical protein
MRRSQVGTGHAQKKLPMHPNLDIVRSTALLCRVSRSPQTTSASAAHHTHHVRQSNTSRYDRTPINPEHDS